MGKDTLEQLDVIIKCLGKVSLNYLLWTRDLKHVCAVAR